MTAYPEKPLAGQTVLVTRPRDLADTPLIDRLNSAGANVILHPVIEIREPAEWGPVDEALSRLHKFGTVVFLSGTGVEYFFGRFREKAGPEGLNNCRIAAIGRATANRIREYGEEVDLVPAKSTSESLADYLIEVAAPEPILLLRANRGNDVLAEQLAAAKLEFAEVAVYESHDVDTVHPETYQLVFDGKVDWVTITSSAIAHSTIALFGAALNNTKLASISPITSQAIRQAGFEAAVEAAKSNFDGMVEAMISY